MTGLIILRLFYLQIIAHNYYKEISQRAQEGYTTLPSRRGEILLEDYHSGEDYQFATNTTLDMIYADPLMIKEPELVAETLAPLLFDLELERELDEKLMQEQYKLLDSISDPALKEAAAAQLKLKTDEELFASYQDGLKETLAAKTRDIILVTEGLDAETSAKIDSLGLEGVEISDSGNLFAYPGKISNKSSVAGKLAEVFGTEKSELETILLGQNRYVILKRKLEPEISGQIEKILEKDRENTLDENGVKVEAPLKFLGIRLKEEYFRYYPEQELAAQVLGYVNSAGDGQYGIEGTFNDILKGKDGIFTSKVDGVGNQITVGESVIEEAQDGADITLTIDRAIQSQVETLIEKGVKDYQADSGQVIVIQPETGAILAMAQYPTYNPNEYGDVFEKEEVILSDQDKIDLYTSGEGDNIRYWLYVQKDPPVRIELFRDPEDPEIYYKYKNTYGPEVYKNKTLQEVYEPGSIFKPLAMAAAVDAGEVEPNSTFVDSGPITIDDFEIDNYNGEHHGVETMTQVLEHSCNIGMSYIAQQLGRTLFYSYLKAFGFTERTDIGIDDEVIGTLEHYDGWAESELVTKAFGQGISVTPIQMAQAFTTLANDGVMMQPYLVKKIEYADGTVEEFTPTPVRQVITEESAKKMTVMMVSTAENGYTYLTLDNHYFAGKSGTAQTYKWGKALEGKGTTIGSFVGYGPIDDPKFFILVKLDHPRTNEFGANTAGHVFSSIAEYLYDYYNFPPDKGTN